MSFEDWDLLIGRVGRFEIIERTFVAEFGWI